MLEAEFHEHVGEENICRSVAEALDRARDLYPEAAKSHPAGTNRGLKKYRCFVADTRICDGGIINFSAQALT